MDCGMDEADTSKPSMFTTGNAAALSRLAVLEASRAAISDSTRVRSTSSGVQRCVLAQQHLRPRCGAPWRTLSRRNPGIQIRGQRRDRLGEQQLSCQLWSSCAAPVTGDLVGVQGSRRRGGQVQHQRIAGRARLRSGAGGQDGAHVGGAEPPERHRPPQRRHELGLAVAAPSPSRTSNSAPRRRFRSRRSRPERLAHPHPKAQEPAFCRGFRRGPRLA